MGLNSHNLIIDSIWERRCLFSDDEGTDEIHLRNLCKIYLPWWKAWKRGMMNSKCGLRNKWLPSSDNQSYQLGLGKCG